MSRIREELHREGRKFTFLCGHDSNLASISAALRFVLPETEQALELHTPIGSKLVFEKWSDGTEEFVAVNLVYQAVGQLQNRTLLSWAVEDGLQAPQVMPIAIEGLTANSDGLYRQADLDARMTEAMAEYDAIEDEPNSVSVPRTVPVNAPQAYTLDGAQATNSTRGVVIEHGQKVIRSH